MPIYFFLVLSIPLFSMINNISGSFCFSVDPHSKCKHNDFRFLLFYPLIQSHIGLQCPNKFHKLLFSSSEIYGKTTILTRKTSFHWYAKEAKKKKKKETRIEHRTHEKQTHESLFSHSLLGSAKKKKISNNKQVRQQDTEETHRILVILALRPALDEDYTVFMWYVPIYCFV